MWLQQPFAQGLPTGQKLILIARQLRRHVHSQMSQIYLLQRLPEQEKQELQTAERLAWRTSDTLSALIFEGYLCNILFDKKEFNACINNAKVLYQKYISAGYKKDAPIAYIYCFKSHMALKEYKQAKKYLELYKIFCC